MRILITGACGTLGRAVRRVVAGEHELVLFDQSEQVEQDGGIRGTITDCEAVRRAARGCDAIVHTAAMHGAFRGKASNAEFIQTNVVGTEHLFQAALEFNIKRIAIASSMEVLIGRGWAAYGTAHVDESMPPRADWIYPVTKLQIEILGHFYAEHHGLEVAQLRLMAFNDGPVRELGLALLARYISADDAGRAMLMAVTRPNIRDEIIHIGPETPLTQADCNAAQSDPAKVIERYWPGSVDVLRRHDLAAEPVHFWPVTRIDRARQVLGWRPRDTFESFLESIGWRRA